MKKILPNICFRDCVNILFYDTEKRAARKKSDRDKNGSFHYVSGDRNYSVYF